MSRLSVLCCLAGLLAPELALADLPFDAQTLGKLEATLAFCAKVNPEAAGSYRSQAQLVLGDAAAEELSAARSSSEYQEAVQSINEELGRIPESQALQTCRRAVAASP